MTWLLTPYALILNQNSKGQYMKTIGFISVFHIYSADPLLSGGQWLSFVILRPVESHFEYWDLCDQTAWKSQPRTSNQGGLAGKQGISGTMKKGEAEINEDSETPRIFARRITVYPAYVEKGCNSNVIIITIHTTSSNLKAEQEVSQTSPSLSELGHLPAPASFNTSDFSSDLIFVSF